MLLSGSILYLDPDLDLAKIVGPGSSFFFFPYIIISSMLSISVNTQSFVFSYL